MKCLKCGTENAEGSLFCIKCGEKLNAENNSTQLNETQTDNNQIESNAPTVNMSTEQVQVAPVVEQPTQPTQTQNNNASVNTNPLNYIMYIIAVVLKPFKNFKDEEAKLNNPKTSLILTLIVTGSMTIINLITTIFNTVHIKTFLGESKWVWENLKEIKWLEVIGKNFLIYAGIIFAITIVFYFAGLVVRKQVNFIKMLSISTTAIIPVVVGGMILSPIGGLIWEYLPMAFTIIGFMYTFVILHELMNDQLQLNGDTKIYVNAVCYSILILVAYFVISRLILSSITSSLYGSLSSLY